MSFLGSFSVALLLLLSFFGQPSVTMATGGGSAKIHARLIDWECWNRVRRGEATVDGSDIVMTPQEHSVGCLKEAGCTSGYYLAVQCDDGAYIPLYNLASDSDSRAAVTTYLDGLSNDTKDVKVTVEGTNMYGGIVGATITECSGTDADCDHGACDGTCSSDLTIYGRNGCEATGISSTSFGFRAESSVALLMAVSVMLGLAVSQ